MKITSPNRWSPAYHFTVTPGNQVDAKKLQELKAWVKHVNNHPNSIYAEKLSVVIRGRGPRRANAIADGLHTTAYDQDLPLRHAVRMDVYVR